VTDNLSLVHLDSRQIRTLAHPLRSRLVGELRLNGPATATKLAGRFGTNTGATSYHLRQLAEVGLVVEDEGGRGRERWWRAAHDVTSWQRDDFADDPDARAASDWLTSSFARNLAIRVEDWTRGVADEPADWRDAAQFSDYILRLDPADLSEMVRELDEVVSRYQDRRGSRSVLLYVYPVPQGAER
jgi:predicted ArsR family transcriptional regulator